MAPILALGAYAPALAQARPPAAQSDAAGSSTQLGEVVVTAQKRSESLQRVPVAVSALDAGTLAKAGIASVNDVALKVPSLGVSESLPTQVSYKLRGLGNEAEVTAFEPEVALFFDGAYRIKSVFGASDLIDVQRIEVLKGPQASLYGKNATAGVINVITAKPTPDFSSAFDLDVNQYRARHRGYVNAPLGDKVAARVSYFVITGIDSLQDSVGVEKPGGNAGDQWGVRPQLSFTPTDRLTVRLIGGYVHRKLRPSSPTMLYSPADVAAQSAVIANPAALAAADPNRLTDGVINADAQPFKPQVLAPGANSRDLIQYCGGCGYRAKVDTAEATAIAEYNLDNAVVTSITSWDHYTGSITLNSAQSPLALGRYSKDDSSESIGQELRISSANSSPFQWLLGGYYYWNKLEQNVRVSNDIAIDEWGIAAVGTTGVFGLPGDGSIEPGSIEERLLAVFGNASYALTDQLTLKVGARYADEKKHAIEDAITIRDPRDVGITLATFVGAQPFDLQRSFSHLTGDVTLQYQIDPDLMVYGSFSTAYKSGGFNLGFSVTPANAPYAPEKLKAYEAGVKGTFLDRRLRMNLAAFYTIVDNYQAASFEGFRFGVQNADATTRGLELDGLAKLGGGFSLDANLAYVDAYYRHFPDGSCFPGNTDTTPTGCDLSGKTLPYSAKFRGSVGLSYEAGNGVYGRVDYFYTSKYNANTNLDPRSVQKGYGLTNLRIGWQRGKLDLALYANNLFDKVYVQYSAAAPATIGPSVQYFLQGHRQVGATLGVKF